MVALNYGDATAFSPERRAEAVAEVQRRLALPYAGEALSGAARGLLRAFIDPGPAGLWAAAAARSRCPTLVHLRRPRPSRRPRRSRRAARDMPHAQIVTLPQAGHVAQMEDPCAGGAVRPTDGRRGGAVRRFRTRAPRRGAGPARTRLVPAAGPLGGRLAGRRRGAGPRAWSGALSRWRSPRPGVRRRCAWDRVVRGTAEGWLVIEHLAGPHVGTLELSRPAVLDDVAHLLYRWHRDRAGGARGGRCTSRAPPTGNARWSPIRGWWQALERGMPPRGRREAELLERSGRPGDRPPRRGRQPAADAARAAAHRLRVRRRAPIRTASSVSWSGRPSSTEAAAAG